MALEGALWRTLVALLWHPGRLTVEYFAGRRARYIAPLRLYLTFSLILFAFGMSGGQLKLGNESIQFKSREEARADRFVCSSCRAPWHCDASTVGGSDRRSSARPC